VEAADSLSSTLVELLGALGSAAAFAKVQAGDARWTVETVVRLSRRVARLEEALEGFREGPPPERKGFAALQSRLMDLGIEKEMWGDGGDDGPEGEKEN
jgi:hypothetical protein